MGFLDLTAVAGPTAGPVLTFASRLELWAMLVGTLATSAIGILAASLRSHRTAHAVRAAATPALRLVASRVEVERA